MVLVFHRHLFRLTNKKGGGEQPKFELDSYSFDIKLVIEIPAVLTGQKDKGTKRRGAFDRIEYPMESKSWQLLVNARPFKIKFWR